MTQSQQLLAQYIQNGSEDAFRELVARYINLVYSTALRVVEGDTPLAEDVTQTVFLRLSRNARKLSHEPLLGGWLHTVACHTASKCLRQERRRQARERQAALMNSLSDHSNADLERVAPILDEAINLLGREDRAAIVLRFFEQRDFRSVGQALGSNEDAARMRVNRALEKLHSILKRRGIALSAAALGTALASQAVTAAPAGMAAGVSGAVLANAAGGIIAANFLKYMITTKVKASVLSAVVIVGVAASLLVQQQARARLRLQDEAFADQSQQAARLAGNNQRLSNLLAQQASLNDQLKNLTKLRAEAASLRLRTNDLARLREENRRLRQQPDLQPKTPLQLKELAAAKGGFARDWASALTTYAWEHQGQFPASFDDAAQYLRVYMDSETNLNRDDFEIAYHGSVYAITNDSTWRYAIVLRERQPWLDAGGNWVKVYGMAGGVGQRVSVPSTWEGVSYDSFSAFEQHYIPASPGQ
jgi:RNA polymerase sigma factor (sigma-70 family)